MNDRKKAEAKLAEEEADKMAKKASRSESKRRRKRTDEQKEPLTAETAAVPSVSTPDSIAESTILSATLKLARLQHKNGDYKDAIKNYERYMEDAKVLYPLYPDICTPQNDTLAINGVIGARQATILKKKGSLYTIKKEPLLNSRRSDFSPALFGDNWEQLYWTSTRPQATGEDLSGITGTKYADIFWTKKDDKNKWLQPEKVEGDLNSEFEEGVCCFSPDGKTMYLTRCTTDPDYPRFAQIYTSQRSDATWGKPQELKISKDTLSTFAHPAVSPDGEWLYFVSDMPGGHGGKDIWRISIEGKTIGGAECLPSPVNTPGDELFPTFRPNGDLYFSSDGHSGMGGLDLFMARQDSVTHQWSITHLPYPMNSAGDDFGMTFEGVHNRGYFSTNRGDGRGWDHLMSFECPEVVQSVKGWVYEKDGYELPSGLVHMIGSDGTNQKISVRGDGSFEVPIQPHVEYLFLGTCKGYLNHVEQLTVDASNVSREFVLQFPLASITAPVLVRNVFYEFDSAELTDNSTQALDSLVALLNENPNVTIELASHCDFRGNDKYNEQLSQRRAESVVNYLIGHGIASDRLTPKGYGESRPKIVKRRIAESHPYLHEGDTLTESFILALKDTAQQEACNALNRRTEFRVLRTTYGLFDHKTTVEGVHNGQTEEEDPLRLEDAATSSDAPRTEPASPISPTLPTEPATPVSPTESEPDPYEDYLW
ncbi:MAG: OmpA family protein [Bacteroidales bacterium]|nr:OmpA family protein [Bacteroidales bacterium]